MASSSKKTDNVSLASKIAIRTWLLKRMGFRAVRVLDTCAGAGHVWRTMRDHVTVEAWCRCDIKPRTAGTLSMTATQAIRSLGMADFNVIDIDPYGEPWEPYGEPLWSNGKIGVSAWSQTGRAEYLMIRRFDS